MGESDKIEVERAIELGRYDGQRQFSSRESREPIPKIVLPKIQDSSLGDWLKEENKR